MMLLYMEAALLVISLIGCAVFLYYMICKLADVVEYSEYSKAHARSEAKKRVAEKAVTKKAAKKPAPVQDREGEVYAAGRGRRDQRSGLYIGFTKQSAGYPKCGKIRPGKQPVPHGFVR